MATRPECVHTSPFYNRLLCRSGERRKPPKVDPNLREFALDLALIPGASINSGVEGTHYTLTYPRLELHWRPRSLGGITSFRTGLQMRTVTASGSDKGAEFLVGGLAGVQRLIHDRIDTTFDLFVEGNGEGAGWGFLVGANYLGRGFRIGPVVGVSYNSGIDQLDRALFVGGALTLDLVEFGQRLKD